MSTGGDIGLYLLVVGSFLLVIIRFHGWKTLLHGMRTETQEFVCEVREAPASLRSWTPPSKADVVEWMRDQYWVLRNEARYIVRDVVPFVKWCYWEVYVFLLVVFGVLAAPAAVVTGRFTNLVGYYTVVAGLVAFGLLVSWAARKVRSWFGRVSMVQWSYCYRRGWRRRTSLC